MKKVVKILALILFSMATILVACKKETVETVAPVTDGASQHTKSEQTNLDGFDELDFVGWSKANWAIFDKYHDENVKVVDIDGSVVNGLAAHDAQGRSAQTAFPTTITEHPIKLADGEWTAVSGIIEFKLPNGATGKNRMVTLARWKNGKIVEEQLFYDKP